MILRVIKVAGHSLEPRYQDGDFVLASSIPILIYGIHPGDTVVFRHPSLGMLIKLVERVEDGGKKVFVIGLNPHSSDSRTFGAVPNMLVLGKVVGHISKK